MIVTSLPKTSILKFFPSKSPISDVVQTQILAELSVFLKTWQAHGADLAAEAHFVNEYVLVVIINDQVNLPSGCSIDSLYRKVSKIEQHFKLDLNNRYVVFVKENPSSEIEPISFFELSSYQSINSGYILNLLSSHLNEFEESWIEITNSPYQLLLK